MHFDLQFNNLIWDWDSKRMRLWHDDTIHFFDKKIKGDIWHDIGLENR